jgi:hypothetical protein
MRTGDIAAHVRDLSQAVPELELLVLFGSIDDAKILAAIGTTLDLYPRYIHAIETRLTRLAR